ncbi:hypothetical protein HWC21_gp136 [Vibrio phage VAP7]|uniref:Uncharacterized protein n=2 Tax=Vapseptimavirus VAP7 TaxID=2841303 RepID=A0A4Y5TVF8_9CAUD|nr:hypothetical protein HWC21_gp136 [Vibrio phage VAP7]QDB73318.1 hypothetical protein [Vibrio phage VAP7]UFD98190.1 hypothetical protein [Vibrio phage BX-1]
MSTSKLKKQLMNTVIPTIQTLLDRKELVNDIPTIEAITNTLLRDVHGTKRQVVIYEPREEAVKKWIKNWVEFEMGSRRSLDLNIIPTGNAKKQLLENSVTRESFRRFYNPRLYENGGHHALLSAPSIVIDEWSNIPTYHVYIDHKGNIFAAFAIYGSSLNNWADKVGLKESISSNKSVPTHYVEAVDEFFVSPRKAVELKLQNM